MVPWQPIPGETPIDPSGLKVPGITSRRELNILEAENILKAVTKYLAKRPARRSAPFDHAWMLKLHKEMFGDVWRWAGKPRTRDLNIGVRFHEIPGQLLNLTRDLRTWSGQGMEFVEQAARLHWRAVWIHPFANGNGRWARLLGNIWLKLNRQPTTMWPEHAIGETSPIRGEYIAAVRAADAGDFGPLIALHRRYAEA